MVGLLMILAGISRVLLSRRLYIVGYLAQSRCQHANMEEEEEQGIMGRSSQPQLPSMLQLSKSCHEGTFFCFVFLYSPSNNSTEETVLTVSRRMCKPVFKRIWAFFW